MATVNHLPLQSKLRIAATSQNSEVLKHLLKDSSWPVIKCIVGNPNLPTDIVELLLIRAQDKSLGSWWLESCLGSNKSVTPALLHGLALLPLNPRVLSRVASHNLDSAVLDHLAHSRSVTVRESVARNINLSEETALYLAKSSSFQIKITLSNNQALTPRVLRKLAKDSEFKVRDNIISNSATTLAILRTMKLIDFVYTEDIAASYFPGPAQELYKQLSPDFEGTLGELIDLVDTTLSK